MSATAAILAAAAASSAASVYNNMQNIKYAQEANDASVGLANTAHQREVRDLEAAGINPILTARGSGAETPGLKTPSLESIDGGIGSSAGSLARAVTGQMKAESDIAKADAKMATADAAVARRMALNQLDRDNVVTAREVIENDAMYEALTGQKIFEHIGYGADGGAYDDLVQQFKNEIASGKYKASLGHAVYDDVRSGISSATDLVGAAKMVKGMIPQKYEEEYNIDRYDKHGHRTSSETRSRYGRR